MKKAILFFIFTICAPISLFSQIGIVNSGNAVGCASSTDTTDVTLSLQSNSAAFNTTGASAIVAIVTSYQGAPTSTVSDNKGNSYPAATGPINGPAAAVTHQIFLSTPTTVGASHTWTINDGSQLMSICVIALSGTNGYLPFVIAATNAGMAATINSGTQNINHTNAFVISTAGFYGATLTSGPSGFSSPVFVNWISSPQAMGTAMAWKNDTTYGTENETWTFSSGIDNAMTSLVFRAANSVNRIGHGPCNVTAVSMNQSDVGTAASSAQQGDVVCLPASPGGVAATWNSQINISGVELRGNGSLPAVGSPRSSKIYLGPAIGGAALIGGNESTSYPTMLDGIDFVLDGNSGVAADQGMLVFGTGGGVGWPFIIHHNDYDVTNRCANPVLNNIASQHGVVYRNRGTGTPPSDLTMGNGCSPSFGHINTNIQVFQNASSTIPWTTVSTEGSKDTGFLNNVYFDTNEFHGFNILTDCSERCRQVARFNTIDGGSVASHGLDSDMDGTRHMELYNNTFLCIAQLQTRAFYANRGSTHKVFSNSYPADPGAGVGCRIDSGGFTDNSFFQFKLNECQNNASTSGYPGSYPGTYPLPHQVASGYDPTNPTFNPNLGLLQVGTAFPQSMQPMYEANNTYGGGVGAWDVNFGSLKQCGAATVSTQSNTLSATTVLSVTGAYPAYINSGEWAVVTFADQVGGAAPTIANTCSDGGTGQAQTWTPISGGSNGNLRLSAWRTQFNRTCVAVITITHAASSAGRALTFTQIRGLDVSPVDQNPAVATYTGVSSYNNPATGTLSTSGGEIALTYAAVADVFDLIFDPLDGTNPCPSGVACKPPLNTIEEQASTCGWNVCIAQPWTMSENGTTGVSPVLSDIIFRRQTTNTAISGGNSMTITNRHGNANAVVGIITFRAGTNASGGPTACSGVREDYAQGSGTPSCLDLLHPDFLQSKRDYFSEVVGDGGASHGARASRPACTVVGQGYWATDQGSWNTSGSGGQGVLDICTVVGTPGTWTNAAYVPAAYPNAFEDVISGGAGTQSFTQQPTNTNSGSNFSPTVTVLVSTGNNDSITLSASAGSCTLTGILTRTAVSGLATFTGLGVSGTPTSGCSINAHDNTDGTIADVVSNTYNMTGVLTFSSQPTNTASGSAFSPTVTVTTSVSSTDSITITLLNCTGGSLTGTTTVSAVAGVATFSGMGMSGTPTTNCSLSAHDNTNSNYPNVTSNTFVTTGTLTFSSQPSNTASGSNFSPTVTVTTSPSSTDSITISLNTCSTGSGNLTGTLTVSAAGGVATFTSVGVTGSATGCTIKAHDNTNAQLADVNSGSFNITSAGVLSFSQQPTTTASGSNFSPTVTVTITPSAADSITISVVTGTCTLTGTTTQTASGGVATFTSVGVSGTPQSGCVLKAHDNTTGTVADVNSSAFNMTGSMAFTAQPTNTLTGNVFSPTIVVTVSPTAADSVALSIGNCPSAHFVGTSTVTANGSGVATFTGLAIVASVASNGCTLTATDNTNSSVNPQVSSTFNVTLPAVPAHRARRILK